MTANYNMYSQESHGFEIPVRPVIHAWLGGRISVKLGIKERIWVLLQDAGERVLTMSMVDVSPKLCASKVSLR